MNEVGDVNAIMTGPPPKKNSANDSSFFQSLQTRIF